MSAARRGFRAVASSAAPASARPNPPRDAISWPTPVIFRRSCSAARSDPELYDRPIGRAGGAVPTPRAVTDAVSGRNRPLAQNTAALFPTLAAPTWDAQPAPGAPAASAGTEAPRAPRGSPFKVFGTMLDVRAQLRWDDRALFTTVRAKPESRRAAGRPRRPYRVVWRAFALPACALSRVAPAVAACDFDAMRRLSRRHPRRSTQLLGWALPLLAGLTAVAVFLPDKSPAQVMRDRERAAAALAQPSVAPSAVDAGDSGSGVHAHDSGGGAPGRRRDAAT